jgi:hypothetical protein
MQTAVEDMMKDIEYFERSRREFLVSESQLLVRC